MLYDDSNSDIVSAAGASQTLGSMHSLNSGPPQRPSLTDLFIMLEVTYQVHLAIICRPHQAVSLPIPHCIEQLNLHLLLMVATGIPPAAAGEMLDLKFSFFIPECENKTRNLFCCSKVSFSAKISTNRRRN